MAIHLVVFDIAGTTVRDDNTVGRCLCEALAAGGVSVSGAEANSVMGIPKPSAIRTLLEQKEQQTPSIERVTQFHDDFLHRIIAFYRTAEVVPTEGAVEVFRDLRQAGIKVALDTGFSRDIVDVILDRLGWSGSGLVDFTVASDEVARGRPHPDLILESMRRAGIGSARQVAKVGDTPADLMEGQNAGCALVVGVTNGTHSRDELARYPHTHLLDSLVQLPLLVLNH